MNLTPEKFHAIVLRIREKREALHYTQSYVSKKMNISQNAYSKIEAGVTNFSIEKLYLIAEILQADIKDFL